LALALALPRLSFEAATMNSSSTIACIYAH
jgi:hypothetical protein